MSLRNTVACLTTVACLAGCSTVSTLSSGIREPWSGSKLDMYIMTSPDASGLRTAGAVLDYPFSLVGDAVVLVFQPPDGVEPFVGPGAQ